MTETAGRILMIGCGNMGGAMLRRWIDDGMDPARVTVVSPSGRPMPSGVRTVASAADAGPADTVILALKPQQLTAFAQGGTMPREVPLLVSILAGVTVATLQRLFLADMVVRAMPNLPVAIGRGVVALHAADADPARRDRASALMAPLGLVEWIDDETAFDAVTALAGCGPAFVFRFAEALADAGAALGLPADQALRLALATVDGAAGMAIMADEPPDVLAERVASPGGSTREGLNVLDRDDALKQLLRATLAASARRNCALGAENA